MRPLCATHNYQFNLLSPLKHAMLTFTFIHLSFFKNTTALCLINEILSSLLSSETQLKLQKKRENKSSYGVQVVVNNSSLPLSLCV